MMTKYHHANQISKQNNQKFSQILLFRLFQWFLIISLELPLLHTGKRCTLTLSTGGNTVDFVYYCIPQNVTRYSLLIVIYNSNSLSTQKTYNDPKFVWQYLCKWNKIILNHILTCELIAWFNFSDLKFSLSVSLAGQCMSYVLECNLFTNKQ